MKKQSEKILVALSGGVDSAVAAYLLQKQGYDVHAVFMKNFSLPTSNKIDCPWEEDQKEAAKVAKHLKIPLQSWNFEHEYHDRVVDYMVTEYQRGRTPNPDVMCNTVIKFGVFLERAKKEGYALIATGHYAGAKKTKDGIYHLLKGKDKNKDQSYFLSGLSQKQLKHVIFPLADITKPEVRTLARRIKLPNADRKDSQGICFIGKVEMSDFLKTWIKPRRGDIVDAAGQVLGNHAGVYYYTIGQRRGINIGGGAPLFVIGKNIKKNQLIVGPQESLDLYKKELIAKDWHWIGESKKLPMRAMAKIRYRQDDQPVTVRKVTGNKVKAIFSLPQRAVSPGQILVVYKGRELLGSGVIV